jgi:glycosyltransferase involved in cell wall biosynthesis
MIRVLHVLSSMNRGGMETFIMNIYRNIDKKKVQFDFLLHTQEECAYNDEIRSLGGKIFSVPSRRNGVLKNRKALDNFFKEHPEYRIVHQHVSSLTYVAPLKIAKKNGVPVRIVHSHNTQQGGSRIHKYIHKYNQLFIESFATHYFACSNLAAKWLYPRKQYKFILINNGIETEKFIYNTEIRDEYRKKFDIENKFVLGHVGRFSPQKNHDFLIDIFKEIHDENNDCVLMLIGDGELRTKIENKVKKLGLQNDVIFTGIRSDIAELYQAMDLFVFPSLYEGLGIVLIEAQASGLKCFTSNKVVPKDVNVTGLVNFLDLDKSAQYWANRIMTNKNYRRNLTLDTIKGAGYDVYQIATNLQKWYEEKIK